MCAPAQSRIVSCKLRVCTTLTCSFPINETAFRYLHEASEPTTGMGRMLDPSMFALTPDIVLGTGVLHEIQHIHGIPPVTAVPVAITMYAASEGREPSGAQE